MPDSIKKRVGKNAVKGENLPDDVKLIQTRLNVYVAAKRLGARPPLAVDGNVAATVPYIEDFQKLVLGFSYPDGTVDPLPGKTMSKLLEDPAAAADIFLRHALALENVAKGPVGGIAADLWNAALTSLITHAAHPKLARWHLLTVVDFRLSRKVERLWVVDLKKRTVLINTWVAHGGGPKGSDGKPIDYQGDFADRFEDGMKFSSLGPYITLNQYTSDLGHLNNKPAMKITGLHKGVNGRAQERGVVFHGADYVKPGVVGNSWGCFATSPEVNPDLVATIKNGSFVFAYHSQYKAPGG